MAFKGKTMKVNQVFKAIGNDQIENMKTRFLMSCMSQRSDEYYIKSLEAKKLGLKATISPMKNKNVKDAIRYSGFDNTPALGSVRLRHSSTSQPLIEDDIQYLPFDKNAMMLEQLWTFLLELEDQNRQADGNITNANMSSLIRFIVHSLQFNTASEAIARVEPMDHQRFSYFLNDLKGQRFLTRFLAIMPASFQKRFFFTSFIVFKDVKIDPASPFAISFLKKLTNYLKDKKVKPKWICAFTQNAINIGFAEIARDKFRSACFASLLLFAKHLIPTLADQDLKTLDTTIKNVHDAIVKDLRASLSTNYDLVYMRSIFSTIISLYPDGNLTSLIVATEV